MAGMKKDFSTLSLRRNAELFIGLPRSRASDEIVGVMLDKRMEVRPQHLEGMAKLGKHIVCAGGLTDEQGKLKGSVVIVEFDDEVNLHTIGSLEGRDVSWNEDAVHGTTVLSLTH